MQVYRQRDHQENDEHYGHDDCNHDHHLLAARLASTA
jgi:hypothetical protein